MYVGCPKAGHVCTRAGPLQVVYTSVTSQIDENQQLRKVREYWYGRPSSLKNT
jgi:hypothetical protein